MPVPELILRPDRGKMAYRLKCRFALAAYPSERALEKAKFAAAEQFVRDMAKQGWQHLEKHGFKMAGPFPALVAATLPPRSQQEQWHVASAKAQAAARLGAHPGRLSGSGYASIVPPVAESERWEFELAGVFVRETLRVEYPDEHEEREMLKNA